MSEVESDSIGAGDSGMWVLLAYQLPREPSTPRIALWRRLRRLGVAQLGDGLVALPADARTREQLEWAAQDVIEHGGTAGVWIARPGLRSQERTLATQLGAARGQEYLQLAADAEAAAELDPAGRSRALAVLRRRWREVTRRDFFPPAERELAATALSAATRKSTACSPGSRAAGPERTSRR